MEAITLMDEGDVETATGESEVVIDAVDNNFKPKYIEVSKGTAVRFVNEGRNIHNVLPVAEDAFSPIEADAFDPGEEDVITFDEVGDFPYYCSLHGTKTKGMIGGIRVVE
ncbi:MAG: plastocyanin/azurin family copper-binding protein [Microthrixaceae bacterium]